MPTQSSATGVTYASAPGAQCTSTESVHGAISTCLRMPHRRGPGAGCGQSQRLADRRVQSVGRRQVPGPKTARAHRFRVLGDLAELAVHQLHPGRFGGLPQRGVQHGPAHAAPDARPERRIDPAVAVDVADPAQRSPGRRDAEPVQVGEGVRHHAFAAGLVQHPVSALDDGDLQPGPRAVQRGGQARGPAAGDEQVDHVRLASAAFSTLIRVRSSAALSTVKTRAVSHAECTNGNAIPSTTTAT